jgi:hypothetical protein
LKHRDAIAPEQAIGDGQGIRQLQRIGQLRFRLNAGTVIMRLASRWNTLRALRVLDWYAN